MRILFTALISLSLSTQVFGAVHKKQHHRHLSKQQMIALGWRPTPLVSDAIKRGKFQGRATVAALPNLVGKN
jgi:hypothetical protein